VEEAGVATALNSALGVLMWIALLSLCLVGLADMANTWRRVPRFFQADATVELARASPDERGQVQ